MIDLKMYENGPAKVMSDLLSRGEKVWVYMGRLDSSHGLTHVDEHAVQTRSPCEERNVSEDHWLLIGTRRSG